MIDLLWISAREAERAALGPAVLYREQWREYDALEKLEARLAAARLRAEVRLRALQGRA